MDEITKRFFAWRKTSGIDDQKIAEAFGHTNTRTFLNWQKEGIPKGKRGTAEFLMTENAADDETSLIRVPFPDDLLEMAHQAASIVSAEFQDYCSRAIRAQAEIDLSKKERGRRPYTMPTRPSLLNEKNPGEGGEDE